MSILKGLLILGCVVFHPVCIAMTNETIPFAGKLEAISTHSTPDTDYLLPLGKAKLDRELGQNLPEKRQLISGELTRNLWQVVSELSLLSTKSHLDEYFEQQPFERMYHCEGRSCGESFIWANDIFNEASLYGDDRKQYLWTFKHLTAEIYAVFYLIERPNRRRYLYREVITVQSADELRTKGYQIIGPVGIGRWQQDLQSIAEKLTPHYAEKVIAVIHQHENIDGVNLARELEKLISASAGNLTEMRVESIGNLAPRINAPASIWVELVDPRWKR